MINCSEDTIQKYLYKKSGNTSVTIILITPDAKKNYSKYIDQAVDKRENTYKYNLVKRL